MSARWHTCRRGEMAGLAAMVALGACGRAPLSDPGDSGAADRTAPEGGEGPAPDLAPDATPDAPDAPPDAPPECARDVECPGGFCVAGVCKPRPEWKPGAKVPGLHTQYTIPGEHGPTVRSDGLEMIFSSQREILTPNRSMPLVLWRTTRPSAASPFGPAQYLKEVNPLEIPPGYLRGPSLGADGLELFFGAFTQSNVSSIHRTTRASLTSAFARGSRVGELNDDATYQNTNPSLAADQRTIVFMSDRRRPRDPDGLDLFWATRAARDQPFSRPVEVPGVNTPYEEFSGCLSPDGRYLVLAYRGPGVLGGIDLRVAVRPAGAGSFAPPLTITELSGVDDDELPFISTDGRLLYYTTGVPEFLPEIWVAERK